MKQRTSLWGSISILIGVVIAILALARGILMYGLLTAAFAVWGLWVIYTRILPARRTQKVRQQTEPPANVNAALMQTLLHHVNYRVSGCLKAAYPDVRWEWVMRDPASFVAQGGTGRIRVYGIPDYDFADVTLDQSGKLSCSLVKLAPVKDTEQKPVPPNQQTVDPQKWYEAEGRKTLERLVADLDSRGHNGLTLKEDGSICIHPDAGGEEITKGAFPSFPGKVYWTRLAEVLEQEGLAAAVQNDCIAVTW